MKKKVLKKAIKDQVNDSLLTEGPFSAIGNVFAGIRNLGADFAGSYKLGAAQNQLKDSAKTIDKEADKANRVLTKIATGLQQSSNPKMKEAGAGISSNTQEIVNSLKTITQQMSGIAQAGIEKTSQGQQPAGAEGQQGDLESQIAPRKYKDKYGFEREESNFDAWLRKIGINKDELNRHKISELADLHSQMVSVGVNPTSVPLEMLAYIVSEIESASLKRRQSKDPKAGAQFVKDINKIKEQVKNKKPAERGRQKMSVKVKSLTPKQVSSQTPEEAAARASQITGTPATPPQASTTTGAEGASGAVRSVRKFNLKLKPTQTASTPTTTPEEQPKKSGEAAAPKPTATTPAVVPPKTEQSAASEKKPPAPIPATAQTPAVQTRRSSAAAAAATAGKPSIPGTGVAATSAAPSGSTKPAGMPATVAGVKPGASAAGDVKKILSGGPKLPGGPITPGGRGQELTRRKQPTAASAAAAAPAGKPAVSGTGVASLGAATPKLTPQQQIQRTESINRLRHFRNKVSRKKQTVPAPTVRADLVNTFYDMGIPNNKQEFQREFARRFPKKQFLITDENWAWIVSQEPRTQMAQKKPQAAAATFPAAATSTPAAAPSTFASTSQAKTVAAPTAPLAAGTAAEMPKSVTSEPAIPSAPSLPPRETGAAKELPPQPSVMQLFPDVPAKAPASAAVATASAGKPSIPGTGIAASLGAAEPSEKPAMMPTTLFSVPPAASAAEDIEKILAGGPSAEGGVEPAKKRPSSRAKKPKPTTESFKNFKLSKFLF